MRQLSLNAECTVLIDDEDYEKVKDYHWYYHKRWGRKHGMGYVQRVKKLSNGKRVTIMLHNQIMGVEPGGNLFVDHISRDTLDNRRCNLRLATAAQNAANRQYCSSLGYKGVSLRTYKGKRISSVRYVARIKIKQKYIDLGSYKTALAAAQAYNEAAKLHFGEFAYLNPV